MTDTDTVTQAGIDNPTVKRIVGPTILLASGAYFDFEDPEGSFFDIKDVARGLSHICRFGGQCPRFYSVAEHSVYVSRVVPKEHALAGLLHDAAEAFVGDMAKPLKVMCPDYQAVEKRVERAVLGRFGLALPLDPSIKEADIRLLATEQAQLMRNSDSWQYTHGRPIVDNLTIECLAPDRASELFIARFEELTGETVHRLASSPPQVQGQTDALREALARINTEVSHGLLGDWTAALRSIRRIAQLALTATPPTVTTDGDLEAALKWGRDEAGGWSDEALGIIERWRARRGEAAFDRWRWWWREQDAESYQTDHDTRDAAIAAGRQEEPGKLIEVIEACCWADDFDEADDVLPFARTRNHEIIPVLNQGAR